MCVLCYEYCASFTGRAILLSFHNNRFLQDLKAWVQGKQEVELVDMVLRIRQKLEKTYIEEVPIGNSVREKLQERINDITHTLPDDLKDILNHES